MIKLSAVLVVVAFCSFGNATTWHIDAENGSDVTGDGSTGSPWATVEKSFASVSGGDTVLLQPGFYGGLELGRDAGVGNAVDGYITYLADPASVTPRPDTWYELGLDRPDPDDPQGHVIFSYIRFNNYTDDMDLDTKTGTPVGHYIILEGLDVVGENIRMVSYVSHVTVRNCNVFGTWGQYDEDISDPGINIYEYWAYGSNYRDILVEGCYATRGSRGVFLSGRMTDVTIRGCHFHNFSGTGISIRSPEHSSNVLFEGNHAHTQIYVPYGNGYGRTVTWADPAAPGSICVIDSASPHYDFITRVSTVTGSTEIRWIDAVDTDSLKLVLEAPFSEPLAAGDSVRLHDGTHGSGIGVTGDSITFRGNRVYACGGTRPFYIYDGGTRIILENNLIYNGISSFTVDFANKMGAGCRIVNNTFVGHRHVNYYSNQNGYDAYGIAMMGTGLQAGVDPASILIANNVFVGTATAPAGAVVKNNIVYSGAAYETDTGGINSGNLEYCAVGVKSGDEPHPFQADSGFFVGGTGFDEGFLEFHSLNLNEAFRLAEGSPADGFGDPAYATATDMVGRNRGVAPDAGCYEYAANGIGDRGRNAVPEGAVVISPNPIQDHAFITVPAGATGFRIFNMSGGIVFDGGIAISAIAGAQHVEPLRLRWNGTDTAGNPLSAGTYVYTINTSAGTNSGYLIKTD